MRYDALHTLAILQGPDVLTVLKDTLRRDSSPLVREGAVRCCTVVEPRTARTAEVLIAALRDPDPRVRECTASLLRKGFNQHFGFQPTARPEDREKAVRRWEEWYEANKTRLRWSAVHRRFELPPEPGTRDSKTEEAASP